VGKNNFIPKGFLFAGIRAEVKKKPGRDLGLILSENLASASGVFTQNRFLSSAVIISKQRLKAGKAKAILVNSGNANCGLGKAGIILAKKTSQALSQKLAIPESSILLASTGVIGEPFPADKILKAIPELVSNLSPAHYPDFADAIMTTDKTQKISAQSLKIQNKKVSILGIAKGAGMIHPQMATMLGFVLTDAEISPKLLKSLLKETVEESFNRITIDGDTSTNDTVFLLANGKSQVKITAQSPALKSFKKALFQVCFELSKMIVADGEGVTRCFYVQVKGAKTKSDAEKIARRIANSPLVKTAIYASDPNWGRIIAGAGNAGVRFDPNQASVFLISADGKSKLEIFKAGARSKSYQGLKAEKIASEIMKKSGFKILFEIKKGKAEFEMLSADFSEDYVRINADYRS